LKINIQIIFKKIKCLNFLIEEQDNHELLSLDEIRSFHTKINLSIVNNGILEAKSRLKDALETKRLLDQKTFVLLKGYMLTSIALILALVFFISSKPITLIFISFIISAFFFCFGIVFLLISLKSANYGTLGNYPDCWLQEGIIDGDQDTHSTMLTYILHAYHDKIWQSDDSNIRKSGFLNLGILSGIIAIIPIMVGLTIQIII